MNLSTWQSDFYRTDPSQIPADAGLRRVEGPAQLELHFELPLITPYRNEWGRDVYGRDTPFDDRPAEIAAASTAGADVCLGPRGFLGVTGGGAHRLVHNGGGRLVLELGPDDTAYVDAEIDGLRGWRSFHRVLGLADRPSMDDLPAAWSAVEYGTWVEQRAAAGVGGAGGNAAAQLSDDFVDRLLERIAALDLPAGKFVIDDGWTTPGRESLGDWRPDPWRFPDLSRTAERIAAAGHVPGLWLSPVQIDRRSGWARSHPEALLPWQPPGEDQIWGDALIAPGPAANRRYRELARRVVDWGFRKIKADLYYGPRRLMLESLEAFALAVHDVDPQVEVEGHLPDPRLGPACGVVRTNDVLVNPRQDWPRLTRAHFAICAWSTPHKILNYDFIGGNDPQVTEADFIEHGEIYRQLATRGYACVGLLPDRFGPSTRAWFADLIRHLHPSASSRSAAAPTLAIPGAER